MALLTLPVGTGGKYGIRPGGFGIGGNGIVTGVLDTEDGEDGEDGDEEVDEEVELLDDVLEELDDPLGMYDGTPQARLQASLESGENAKPPSALQVS